MTQFASSHEEVSLELKVVHVEEIAENIIELEFAEINGERLQE